MPDGLANRRPLAFMLVLGVLGGAGLIATVILSHRGPMIFFPYAAIVLVGALYMRFDRVRPFTRRLILSASSFMIATLILYVFIPLFQVRTDSNISVLGHAWRLALMLLIGGVVACVIAAFTATKTIEAT